ncbi:MAG: serine/threonine protein kinase [Gammaproteobacteria bacterium]|nr:serine/threonine protein kinase [Gammaproteobacteria bacterium]
MTSDSDSSLDATRTSQAHSRLLRSGDVLAERYRIEDTIGVGAMGTVYRAYDTRLDLVVALKILHASIADDSNSIQRFESELKLARQISHPNVVRIHDIGEHETLSFLSMDLIPGRPLDDILNTDGKLDPERATKIAAGIARGLNAAHAQHVVHRDLKPANILVDDNDNAVITDFGVARSAASARLTQTGYFVGTPDYLAPEQARGGEIDGRSDIYALGLILYEML